MSYIKPEQLRKEAQETLASLKGKELTNRDRMQIPLQEMPPTS